MALHCATWYFLSVTWIMLYLVNQTDPGILITSSALYSLSGGDHHGTHTLAGVGGSATSGRRRMCSWMQLLIRRLCSFLPWLSSSFFARDVARDGGDGQSVIDSIAPEVERCFSSDMASIGMSLPTSSRKAIMT